MTADECHSWQKLKAQHRRCQRHQVPTYLSGALRDNVGPLRVSFSLQTANHKAPLPIHFTLGSRSIFGHGIKCFNSLPIPERGRVAWHRDIA